MLDRESGTDTIHDFGTGRDTIILRGGLGFTDLDIKQRAEDAVVNDPSDTLSTTLVDFDASQLTEADFDFIA